MRKIRSISIKLLDNKEYEMQFQRIFKGFHGTIQGVHTIEFTITFQEDKYRLHSEPEMAPELKDRIAEVLRPYNESIEKPDFPGL